MPYRKDAAGRWHVELCVQRRRVHRKLPPGATEADAKHLDAELRVALTRDVAPVIPGDPLILDLLAHYAETHAPAALRSADTAKHHAVRVGALAAGWRASQARQFAALIDVTVRHVYGRLTIYPENTRAKRLAELTGKKTLDAADLVMAENLGMHVNCASSDYRRWLGDAMAAVRRLRRAAA